MRHSTVFAIALAIGASIWVISGQIGGKAREPAATVTPSETRPSDKIQKVLVEDITAQTLNAAIRTNGRTMADRMVMAKSELTGKVAMVGAAEGSIVKSGDELIRIENNDRGAQLSEMQAMLRQRTIEYDAAQALAKDGYASRTQLAQARASLDSARAALRRAELDSGNLSVRAPFDGIVAERMVEKGDFVDMGMAVARIVDLDPIKAVGFVTENQVGHLQTGSPAQIELLQPGAASYTGVISFVAPQSDADTRTYKVEVTIPNPDATLRDGQTIRIILPTNSQPAYKISPSSLSLADDGTVGVKIVDDANKVRFIPVTILEDKPDAFWVGGLPDKVRLITQGQDFVQDNQIVEPVFADTLKTEKAPEAEPVR